MSESVQQHRESAPDHVRVAILTVSDSRTPENDTGGDAIQEPLESAGHQTVDRRLVRDEPESIQTALVEMLDREDVDAVVTTGGTGVSARDSTYEVVSRTIDRPLDGFGEIFRMLSYEEIGAAAFLSRATAGVVNVPSGAKFVASLPGSSNAVRLAVEKLLVPEIAHVVFELRKHAE